MTDLTPITPLGAANAVQERHGRFQLAEVTSTAMASVTARQGGETATVQLIKSLTGQTAPQPGHMAGGDVTAFWTGPEQWMIQTPYDGFEDIAAQITRQAAGCASVTEQSDAWCTWTLNGPDLAAVFERLCAVNLRQWRGGEATRTTLEHLSCYLLCHSPERISVIGPRSSAASLHHALVTAMKSAA